MRKVVYITEKQQQEILDRYLNESLVVNSAQVNSIRNYLNQWYRANYTDDDIGFDGLPKTVLNITYVNAQGQPKMNLKVDELLDVLDDKFKHFVTDNASRRAYFNQIISDWLNGSIRKTGQLSVNVISDDNILKFKVKPKKKKEDTANPPAEEKKDDNKKKEKNKDKKKKDSK